MNNLSQNVLSQNVALTLLRVWVGLIFVLHGGQKLFVMGPAATAGMFAKIGIPLPGVSVWLVIFAEFFCGIAVLLGLFTRLAAIPIAIDMLGAIMFVHGRHGVFAQNGGFEYPLTLLIASVVLVWAGPGPYAVDNLLPQRGTDVSGGPVRKVA